MEVANMSRRISKEEEDDVPLPGFRFHPTDEELVGFYLRRKVEKRSISIELIKQADIYKYDPWDLPKSSNVGDQKEWYFFCKRGRKYKNSIRPNRVTGSGFWKATGIDRPIYSSGGEGRDCIGLKKSLVYYRGSAGKGTKTEWMMHEFRLPPVNAKTTRHTVDSTSIAQEAEVWTLCRILKRKVSDRKPSLADWTRDQPDKKRTTINYTMNPGVVDGGRSNTCSAESCDHNGHQSKYISFNQDHHNKPFPSHLHHENNIHNIDHQQFHGQYFSSSAPISDASLLSSYTDINELLRHADWDDLRSIFDCAAAANPF